MSLRNFIVLVLAAVFLIQIALLGERIVSRQDRADRVTVLYWEKWTGAEGEEMHKVVDRFNRSQDRIFVKYLSISGVDTKTMLATAGGHPPDVAGIWQEQICQFADANALTDLTSLARESGLTRDYYIHAYWDALTYRGHLWGLPSTPASIALYVRSDLVPAPFNSPKGFPKTLGEMDKLAISISQKGPNGELKLAGYMPSDPGWWNWSWAGLFGGSLMKDGSPRLDSPESIEAMHWVQSYAKTFGSREVQTFQSGFGNFSSPQDPFMQGKVAMELNGPWKAQYINVYKPGVKWFAVPFPYPDSRPDLAGHSVLAQDILVIPRGAPHAKEAFEFVRYVQRQDVMEGLCSAHGKNSPLAKVSEHFFRTHPNPYIRLFDALARSPKALVPPAIGIWPQMGSELGVAFDAVNTGQKSPEEAMHDAQARVMDAWQTYQAQVLDR